MKKLTLTTALACAILTGIAAMAGIDGKWITTLKPGDGNSFQVTYIFKSAGNKFTGDVEFPGNQDFAINNGTIKGDSIKFFVMLNGHGVPNYGRIYTDSIALDVMMNGAKYHHKLLRAN